jgi:uncharacterized protein (TIGR03083 family)
MSEDVHAWTTSNRLLVADVLASLDERQWAAPTLCAGWTVRVLAGHLLQPMTVGFGRFLLTALRHRGDTDATVDDLARRLAQPPSRTSSSQRCAASRLCARTRPASGPLGPFAETCVHLRDVARPLGLDADVPVHHWTHLLGYLVSPQAAPALVPPDRLAGLALHATDAPLVREAAAPPSRGPAEALAMAATGRADALAQLTGPGCGRPGPPAGLTRDRCDDLGAGASGGDRHVPAGGRLWGLGTTSSAVACHSRSAPAASTAAAIAVGTVTGRAGTRHSRSRAYARRRLDRLWGPGTGCARSTCHSRSRAYARLIGCGDLGTGRARRSPLPGRCGPTRRGPPQR